MKVYLVMQCDDDGYNSCPSCVFSTREKAEKYVEVNDKIEEYYKFYIDKLELDEREIPQDTKVAEYYSYYYGIDPFDKIDETSLQSFLYMSDEEYNKLSQEEIKQKLEWANHPDNRWINDPDDKTKRIDDGELTVERNNDGVTVYSKKSFDEAKQVALDMWNKEKGV